MQPEKSTEGPEPEGPKPTAGPDRCHNRCTGRTDEYACRIYTCNHFLIRIPSE